MKDEIKKLKRNILEESRKIANESQKDSSQSDGESANGRMRMALSTEMSEKNYGRLRRGRRRNMRREDRRNRV